MTLSFPFSRFFSFFLVISGSRSSGLVLFNLFVFTPGKQKRSEVIWPATCNRKQKGRATKAEKKILFFLSLTRKEDEGKEKRGRKKRKAYFALNSIIFCYSFLTFFYHAQPFLSSILALLLLL